MDEASLLSTITDLASKTTGRSDLDISAETDLIADDILDSLDWSVFLLDLEKHFDISIPDDLVEEHNLQVAGNLMRHIRETA